MAPKKHLIVIHGRASKPAHKEHEKLVQNSLLHGLRRVAKEAQTAVKSRAVKYSYVYYGDINNRFLASNSEEMREQLSGKDPLHGNGACQPEGAYDGDLARLLAQTRFDKTAYKRFLKNHRDRRFLDEAADAVSWFTDLIRLSEKLVAKATPDMGAYLLTRKVGSEVRTRLQVPLKKSLLAGDDICLVAHSMGCIVCYDVLWKFSQMSEYDKVQSSGNRVNLWITLGNPLGEPGVRKNLYDANESEDGKYPKCIVRDWVNISAADDFVAHDEKIRDDFREMLRLDYVRSIRDITRGVYNFWAGWNGANPHKFYGYLDNPKVAEQIAAWILS